MYVLSDLSFTVLRQINIVIYFRVTLEHLGLQNKALGCTSDRVQLDMNMVKMAVVFMCIFEFHI